MANQVTTLKMGQKFKQTPIGEIPLDWECSPLTSIVRQQRGAIKIGPFGSQLKKMDLAPQGFNVIRMDSHLLRLQLDRNRVDPNYVGYCLHDWTGVQQQIKSMSQGGIMSGLNSAIIRTVKIPIPPLPEQKKIAEILSSLDDAIEKTNSVFTKIRTLKKGLTQHLLAHGGGNNGALKKSIIGSIPRQWDIVPLAKACLKIQDGTHFSPESKDGPYMYITSKNIRMGRIDLSDVALISEEEHRPIFQRADVRKGDVLLTKDGAQAGNIAINTIEEEFSLLSSVAMLRPDEAITSAEWIYQFYASERGQQLIQRHIAGQAIPRLTLEKINALPLALPTLHEQNKIAAVLSGLDSSLKRVEAHTLCLVNMKEGLMQTLLTGRIRVS